MNGHHGHHGRNPRNPRNPSIIAALLGLQLALTSTPASALPRSELPSASDSFRGLLGEPGSGSPREPSGRNDPTRLAAPKPRQARDPADAAGLATMEAILARYRNAARIGAHTLASVVAVEAEQGRNTLQKRYGERISKRHEQARRLRLDAIARYEKFLAEHPDDPAWTPEILFRLAELHFEADSERFAREEDSYEDALLAYRRIEA